MLDIKFIRDNIEQVKKTCTQKRCSVDVDRLLELDEKRRSRIGDIQNLEAERNKLSKGKPSEAEIVHVKKVKEDIAALQSEYDVIYKEFIALLYTVPNILHPDVPIGIDETQNVVIKKNGEPRVFSFQPREHWDIGVEKDIIDIKRAGEITGTRFAYLKGDLVLLEFALIQYALSVVTNEGVLSQIATQAGLTVSTKPFIPVVPPVMIRGDVMNKMARLEPKEERYFIQSDELYLVGSAEHTLGPLHMEETLKEQDLPIRYIGFSTAFRREAGSYGKDTKGILRVHQFDKLEFESFAPPALALAEQDFILAIQQHLMSGLGLPHQVVFKCSGDMGAPDYREFDIETWMPGQGRYRETHTADYMTDYQSRRLNTKVRLADGTTEFVHMNDATVFAIGRTLIAIIENYQQEDRSILIPDVLHPWVGKRVIK